MVLLLAINYINIVLKYIIESDKMDNKKIVFIVSGIVFFSIVTLLTVILIKNNMLENVFNQILVKNQKSN